MTRHAFFVLPSTMDEHVRKCVEAARRTIASVDVDPQNSVRATRVQVFDVTPGRHADTLRSRDAIALYRLLHRQRILVFAFSDVWVRTDPRRDNVDRKAISLKRFVEHKATFARIHKEADVSRMASIHEARCAGVACTGDDDPRVLPLHS